MGYFLGYFQGQCREQPIHTMIKFSYLLQALVGEAKHTAAQFQVIEGNYQLVVEALIRKYGRDTSIAEDLLQRLETCKAEDTSTKQRSNLVELITAILTQLTVKGQDVNQRLVLNLVLRKFNSDIRIRALGRRERLNSIEEWTWPVLQKDLIVPVQEPQHSWQGISYALAVHHTPTCRNQSLPTGNRPQNNQERPRWQQATQPRPQPVQSSGNQRQPTTRRQTQTTLRQANQNVITFEEERNQQDKSDSEDESQVCQISGEKNHKGVLLLTGAALIKGPNACKQVRVLMDTGSELSFIDAKLVDELHLKVEGRTMLRLKTFGTKVAKEEEHRIAEVCMVDREGITHKCQLFDSSVITIKVNKPQLTAEDLQHIEENSIQLSSLPEDCDKPRVLLGCDHLWEMVEGGKHRLPSGLRLINTKFGYMVSGKKKPSSTEEENANVLQMEASKEEQDIWDNYWKIESSGTNEYTGTEKNEETMTDEKVMKKSKETIVKRPDGYYVRLP
ncbi:Tas retrotransposon peptidase A16 [Oesophagostomum dentatum]|uniref:Tas retrotransposon peptidase A16 n=1 Tax=Oesophagostomum dentatum TaxID=61180 RepID=A0A0B1TG60_OESDE|nr:Tas retrotransposon peptidase A16 [Oesophagostomum dentatum]